MTNQVVTELVIDSGPSQQGAQAYVRSMDLAEDAAGRVVDQTRAVERAIEAQTVTMTRSTDTTSNAGRAFDRLRNSVDPAARAQAALERATVTLNGAVARGVTTQEEAARVLDLVRQKYDAAGNEAGQYGEKAANAGSATDKASQAVNRMVGLLATLGVALGVRQLVEYADAWTNAGNRISAVSAGLGVDVEATRTALADLAVETRSDFGATITLYSRLAGAAENLGASESDLLAVVRTVNEAMALSGAAGGEAAGAIRQLGQALGSGALRGDELNSILEQAPILAQAVATEMGVATTELRRLGEEGAITSQIVYDALLNSSDGIHASFQATETTVGQALTNLTTRFTEFVGGANGATGATGALVSVLDFVAENIGTVSIALGVLAAAFVAVKVVEFASSLSALVGGFGVLRTAMSFLLTNPFGLAITAITTIIGAIFLMRDRTEEATVSLEAHETIVNRVRDAYDSAAGATSDWASRIEGLTGSQAVLNIQARAEDLAAAQAALAERPAFADGSADLRLLAASVQNLKDQFIAGDLTLRQFNIAMDTLADNTRITAEFAVQQQELAAAFDAARRASEEAGAVYRVLQGNATDADFAMLGLTQRMEEGADAASRLADEAARAAAAVAALNGGGGAATPATVPATQFHDGGVVGRGGVPRMAPAALFVNAPRFHTGLASDEFPAILQRGETVIPAGGSIATMAPGVTGAVSDLTAQLKEAKSAAVNFGVSFVQALIAAKSPLEALQGSLSSLSSSMLSSAGQSFMTGNFAGGIIKGVIGIVAGLIARRIAERRELMAAQEAWRNMSDELADFAGRLAGDGEGALAGAIAAATAEMQPFIDAAKKAKASTAELEAMLDGYARKVSTEFLARFGMLVDAFESGLGQGSPAVAAAQNVAKVGEELLAFVDDIRVATETLRGNGDAIREAEGAAQAYALSLLRTPPALSEVETELLRIEGTAAALSDVLVALGMSSAEAAAAIDAGVSAAIGDLRQQFTQDLGAKINDALGRGYLNEVSDLVGEAAQLLEDATALGLSGTDVSAYFAAQAQAIVDGAGLTGDAFAELVDLFPQLAGVVHEASGSVEAAMERINDAAAGVLDYVRGLLTGSSSTLSPEARLANAQAAYDAQIALAQGGDLGAQQKITGFADALLEAARTMFASSAGYQDIFARVTSELLGLPVVGQATDPSTAALRDSLGGMSTGAALALAPSGGVSLGVTASGAASLPVPANDRGTRQNFVDLMQVAQGVGTAQIAAINGSGDRIVERLEAIERFLRQQSERPRRAGAA